MSRSITKTIFIANLLTLIFFRYACAGEPVLKIGFVGTLTGASAVTGKDAENGVIMAIEDLNAKGVMIAGKPYKIELIAEDDAGEPKQATLAAQLLVDSNVKAVIGHLTSGTTIPASKIYYQAGIPQLTTTATNPLYTHQGFKSAFRMCPNDDQLGQALGRYAVQALKAQRIAIIDDATSYGQGLAVQFSKTVKATSATALIVAKDQATDKTVDFHAILTRIKQSKPDAIFFGGMYSTAAPLLLQMKSLGIKAKFMGGDGICAPLILPTLLGSELQDDQVFCTDLGGPDTKAVEAWSTNFSKRFGRRQGNAEYSYDAVMLLIEAMKQAGSIEPAIYLPALAKTKYQGITGFIEFDKNGDLLNAPINMYTFVGGKQKLVPVDH